MCLQFSIFLALPKPIQQATTFQLLKISLRYCVGKRIIHGSYTISDKLNVYSPPARVKKFKQFFVLLDPPFAFRDFGWEPIVTNVLPDNNSAARDSDTVTGSAHYRATGGASRIQRALNYSNNHTHERFKF